MNSENAKPPDTDTEMIKEYLRDLRTDLRMMARDIKDHISREDKQFDNINNKMDTESKYVRSEFGKIRETIAQHKVMISLISSGVALAVSWGYAYLSK